MKGNPTADNQLVCQSFVLPFVGIKVVFRVDYIYNRPLNRCVWGVCASVRKSFKLLWKVGE